MVIDGTGSITFDVLDWLAEQSIPLVRLTWRGEVVCVIGGAAFAGIPPRVEWQRETRLDPERRVNFAAELIARKLESSLATLRWAIEPSRTREIAEDQAESGIRTLRGGSVATVDQVRLLEARAAAAYFSAWRTLPIHWGQRSKHPIPADWSRVRGRASNRGGFAQGNRHATHPVNAMLNYAYAALESRVQIAAASSGFDPKQGILHHDRDDALAFVYDMMEPERPKVDRAVLGFIDATTFTGADFVLRSDGVCRVAPQAPSLAAIRAVAAAAVALRSTRTALRAKHKLSLRDLYRSLDLPGESPLKDAQATLDEAVRTAYGMPPMADPLGFLLTLNFSLAHAEESGVSIQGPGLPPEAIDPTEFRSSDCVSMS